MRMLRKCFLSHQRRLLGKWQRVEIFRTQSASMAVLKILPAFLCQFPKWKGITSIMSWELSMERCDLQGESRVNLDLRCHDSIICRSELQVLFDKQVHKLIRLIDKQLQNMQQRHPNETIVSQACWWILRYNWHSQDPSCLIWRARPFSLRPRKTERPLWTWHNSSQCYEFASSSCPRSPVSSLQGSCFESPP